MALTPSNMLPLGTPAPDFRLPDTVSGRTLALSELKSGKATVLMFICNHCPYVKHVNPELIRVARDYQPQGVSFIAISSNDAANYPEDAPEKMQETAARLGYPFPYLYDESQLKLVYRGRLDGSTPGNEVPLTGHDLRAALDAVLAGRPVNPDQKPGMGCNIKWKSRAGA